MKKRSVAVKRKNIYVILGLLAVLVGSLAYLALQKKTREGFEVKKTVSSVKKSGNDTKEKKVEMDPSGNKTEPEPAAAPPAKKGTEAAITGILTSILGKS